MKNWKAILALMFVFLAGTVFGVVATRVVTRNIIRRALQHPDLVRARIEHELVRKLKLDATQEAKVHDVLMNSQTQLHALRQEFQPQFAAIMSNSQEQISVILNPEQRERFDKFREENRRILQFSTPSSPRP